MRDVGGFMEVILSVFTIVSFFSTNILYEKSLVNNLFEFDINRKKIIIHNNYQNQLKRNNLDKKISRKNELKLDYNLINNDIIITSKNNLNNNNKLRNYFGSNLELKRIKKKKNNLKRNYNNRKYYIERNINNENNIRNIDIYNFKNENEEKDSTLIKKIEINKCCIYFCFLCVRKRKNMENILLDEGMRIIIEKLDIINIFKNLCKDDIDLSEKNIIKMSNNCIKGLEEINNSYCNT
jgi:hypothetical protein